MRHLRGKTFEIKLIQVLGYDLVFAYVDQVSLLVLVWLFQKILVPPSQLGLHIRLLKKEKMYLITQSLQIPYLYRKKKPRWDIEQNFMNMNKTKDDFEKSCSSSVTFLYKNHSQ